MFNLRVPLLVSLALAVLGCAPKAPTTTYTPPPEEVYAVPHEVVWGAVLETFTDLEIPIENIETASGFIRSDFMRWNATTAEFLDCGQVWKGALSGGWQGPDNARFRITVFVREKADGTTSLRFREAAEATDKGQPVRCEPTGVLGDTFLRQFKTRIEKEPGAP